MLSSRPQDAAAPPPAGIGRDRPPGAPRTPQDGRRRRSRAIGRDRAPDAAVPHHPQATKNSERTATEHVFAPAAKPRPWPNPGASGGRTPRTQPTNRRTYPGWEASSITPTPYPPLEPGDVTVGLVAPSGDLSETLKGIGDVSSPTAAVDHPGATLAGVFPRRPFIIQAILSQGHQDPC
jgi:hypothetical protein